MYIMARHLVIPVAKRLAHRLLPTRISPNTVTAASCLCGVFAAAVPLLADTWTGRILSALLVHLSITLDFTDGYLARLRGTDSTVGYWFDTTMDEVVKFSLFLGMTLLVMLDGVRWGFGAGIVTLLLYHVLTSSHWITVSLENGASGGAAARAVPRWRSGWIGMVKRVYERLNYLDVHLYVIALALLLRLEAVVLAMFAVIYTFRFFRMLQLRLFTRTLS
jgi:phosphatidylglycerophosphate synthase